MQIGKIENYPSFCILGTNPKLGIAELESILGAKSLAPFGSGAVLVKQTNGQIDHRKLGGTKKICKVLSEVPNDFANIKKYLLQTTPIHAKKLPEGKLTVGLSFYNFSVSKKQLSELGNAIKQAIKGDGRPVRVIYGPNSTLNSAQVLHNRLIGPRAWELVIIKDKNRTLLCQTVSEQDIEAYANRDQSRPKRDARVGMLPPKLAQIIINLSANSRKTSNPPNQIIFDPFCGTGVLLQEALLMGYYAIGSDINENMVKYATENLNWLKRKFDNLPKASILLADATQSKFKYEFNAIATETYLGKPISQLLSTSELAKYVTECDRIMEAFLMNLHTQINSKTGICIAVPVWNSAQGLKHLPLIDRLEEIGYNRQSFVHVLADDLVYIRPGQFVGRQMLVLRKV